MKLPAQLPIKPFIAPATGTVTLPGSKSLTNRALILATLCDNPITLEKPLFSEDTRLMMTALARMGCTIKAEEDGNSPSITISKNHSTPPTSIISLYTGLSGTTARFLTALCATAPAGVYRIDGVPQMRRRPMRGLIDALRTLGTDIRCTAEEGFLPVEIHAHGLHGGAVAIDALESSQMLSALLMVAPLATSGIDITLTNSVRQPFVEMTISLMQQFGQPPVGHPTEKRLHIASGHRYRLPAVAHGTYTIEPDATAASYFLALPLVTGGALTLPRLRLHEDGGLQGDTRFASAISRAGATLTASNTGLTATFDRGTLRHAITENFNEFSDTFLTFAATAPLLDGVTRITGIEHTRRQETDRVAGAARELARLGQRVTETADSLEITPDREKMRALSQTAPIVIETYGDHRFAMSFAILGCHDLHSDGRPWLTIKNPACCAKTFPQFFDMLDELRIKSEKQQPNSR
jgi:3-phosphoshikimate 1-carboxyvinyltransferase